MRNLIILLSTLVISVLFMFYQPQGSVGFLFSDMVLTWNLWFYYLFEHLIRLMLSIVILSLATKYRFAVKVFVAIQCVEALDYVLTYGEPWFDSKVFTWNTIKVGLFGCAILYEKYGKL